MKLGRAFAIAAAFVALALASTTPALAFQTDVRQIDPSELTRHPEWASGRQVDVEDRAQFQYHEGTRFDEIRLKRAESVVVKLPVNLRPERGDEARVVRLQGNLRKAGDTWVIDVTALSYLPKDMDRLEQGVKSLGRDDYKNRLAWARWALKRAEEYNDEVLKARALDIEGDATWAEAERAESPDQPALWLALAKRSKGRLPEPDPSALAHRAFRARLLAAKSAAEFEGLAQEIADFFPKAGKPAPSADLASSEFAYASEPGRAYRRASNAARAALDRKLLADAIQNYLERQATDHPTQVMDLAGQAQTKLPDRPEVARKLRAQGLDTAARDVSSLRADEVETLAKDFENDGHPERAKDLRRRWLDDTRENKLSASDATGRVLLAGRYLDLLGDRETAKTLLLDALRIDAKYRDAEDALRRMGYRKLNNSWVDSEAARAGASSSEPDAASAPPSSGEGGLFHGLTTAQVKSKLGVPNQVTRAASQGLILEQWVYKSPSATQYINFVRRPTMPQATVEAYYSLP